MGKIKKLASAENYLNLANKFYRDGRFRKAYEYYKVALALDPTNFQAKGNLAVVLNELGRREEALAILKEVIVADPNNFTTLYNIGLLSLDLGHLDDAADCFSKATKVNAASVWSYNYLGVALMKLGRLTEAEIAFRKGISQDPANSSLHSNLGNVLRQEGRPNEAIKSYQIATWIDPAKAEAFGNLGSTLTFVGNLESAKDQLMEAIKLKPNVPEFYYNLAMYEKEVDDLGLAMKNLEKVAELKPDFDGLWSSYYLTCRQACDWKKLAEVEKRLEEVGEEEPFVSLVRTEDPVKNLASAKIYSNKIERSVGGRRYENYENKREHKKIRLGYLSGDFRQHPIGELVASMFGYHDRDRFEVFAYSYGRDDGSGVRKMVQQGVDKFVEAKPMSFFQAADQIRDDEVDILIDLTGNTKGNRLEICALRPAPAQVTWLGFPGTSGASFFDYAIVDQTVVSDTDAPFYTEKLLFLPHAYQVNNDQVFPSRKGYRRSDFGLPDNGVVFASYNQSYKIEPAVWAVWMNILKKVPGSVLWLWRQNKEAEKNLLVEAKDSGIDEKRIVFGDKLPKEEHLERLALVDLGLDTLTYGGHTTTSDSLWAGVPVVTILGRHFASRVCASLLDEVGLPELVVGDLTEYENLVVDLARNPGKLSQLKKKLTREKLLKNLYNTKRFVKSLEKIYQEIYG